MVATLKDNVSSLFALPDDVRAVIGFGGAFVMNYARYFASVRKCCCMLVPATPSAEGLIQPYVKVNGRLYPAAEPDIITVDGNLFFENNFASTFSHLISKEITLFDLKLDSILSGRRFCSECFALAREAATIADNILSFGDRGLKLFEADLKLALAFRFGLPQGSEVSMAKAMVKKTGADERICEFYSYRYLSKIYVEFYTDGFIDNLYVPDYLNIISAASSLCDIPSSELIKKLIIPTPEQNQAMSLLYMESKPYFLSEANKILNNLSKAEETYKKLDGTEIKFEPDYIKNLTFFLAEQNQLISVPALMRDFGLIDTKNEKTMNLKE
jgi:hypothetical protein